MKATYQFCNIRSLFFCCSLVELVDRAGSSLGSRATCFQKLGLAWLSFLKARGKLDVIFFGSKAQSFTGSPLIGWKKWSMKSPSYEKSVLWEEFIIIININVRHTFHSEFSALKTQNFLLHKSMAVGLTWRFPQEFKKKIKRKIFFCHDKKFFSALLISILFSKFSDIAFLLWKISTLTTPDWDMLCPHVVQTSTCHRLVRICAYFDVLSFTNFIKWFDIFGFISL